MSSSSSRISSCCTVFSRKRSSSDRKKALPDLPGDANKRSALQQHTSCYCVIGFTSAGFLEKLLHLCSNLMSVTQRCAEIVILSDASLSLVRNMLAACSLDSMTAAVDTQPDFRTMWNAAADRETACYVACAVPARHQRSHYCWSFAMFACCRPLHLPRRFLPVCASRLFSDFVIPQCMVMLTCRLLGRAGSPCCQCQRAA